VDKKINGRKRRIVVDTLGLILAVVVLPAVCTTEMAPHACYGS
jgi:hypothetical protein